MLAIVERLATILAIEESDSKKLTNVDPDEFSIEMVNASYEWGFRVADDQSKAMTGRKLVETESTPVISELNFSLHYDDLFVVVGQVGCE